MEHILCYGDSNTWGETANGGQWPTELQWPTLLGLKLNSHKGEPAYRVSSKGYSSRIAGDYEREYEDRNGKTDFYKETGTEGTIDLLVIALGTNDLKKKYDRSAKNIYHDLLWYADKVAKVIFVAPPNFNTKKEYFDAEESVRQELIQLLEKSAYPIVVFNDLEMGEDGLHFSKKAHERVAEAVHNEVKELSHEV